MTLTGELLIGTAGAPATAGTMKAFNPAIGELIEPEFAFGGAAEADRAVRLADEAVDSYSHTRLAERAAFLDLIADKLEAVKDELAARASLEAGLPAPPVRGRGGMGRRRVPQVRHRCPSGPLPPGGHRRRATGRPAHTAYGPPAAEGGPRPRGDLRRQQLPDLLLSGGRRHRLSPGGRLPCRPQGPQRTPRRFRDPGPEEFGTALTDFFRTSGRPENAHRVKRLFDGGLQRPDGVERDLGRHVAHSS